MSNPYFTKSGYPSTNARAVSASLRSEIANIEAGFDLLPTLSGNGSEIIAVNSGATALEAITTTGTGSGVRATSPTLVTPILGVAAATSINGVAITGTGTIASGGGIAVSSSTPAVTNATNFSSGPTLQNSMRHVRIADFVLGYATFVANITSAGVATSFDLDLPVALSSGLGINLDWGTGSVCISTGGASRISVKPSSQTLLHVAFQSDSNGAVLLDIFFVYRIA